jgi:chaperonin GroES
MTIKPLGNRLVVQLIKQKNTTASGIITSTKEEPEQGMGKVIAIGKGQGDDENIKDLGLEIGQIVLFPRYAGEEIKDQNNPDVVYKVLKGSDIIAVLED